MGDARLGAVVDLLSQSPIPLFTGGKWHSARDGAVLEVLNPADGNRLATVSAAGPADVDEAIEAAWSAFGQWSSLSAKDRAVVLHRLADLVEARADEIATLESLDVGKPVSDAMEFDVPFAAQGFRYFADVSVHARRSEPIALWGSRPGNFTLLVDRSVSSSRGTSPLCSSRGGQRPLLPRGTPLS